MANPDGTFTFAFATTNGASYIPEFTDSITSGSWTALAPRPGNGLEQTVTQPAVPRRFFRVRRQ